MNRKTFDIIYGSLQDNDKLIYQLECLMKLNDMLKGENEINYIRIETQNGQSIFINDEILIRQITPVLLQNNSFYKQLIEGARAGSEMLLDRIRIKEIGTIKLQREC